ncbi:transporter [Micromonospora rosaria]|uniref:Transporter n=1 Tax=Micromonospora rosaria TaxID=47874 RepID=A0A136PSD1_9ACTN|nr:alpha/beta hydrolase [Micromonospora rosaria]KXK61295.1 transporter [Micromonospora rosaria]
MRPRMRALTVAVAAGMLVAGSGTGAAGAGPRAGDRDRGYRADITWVPCPEAADVECGTVPMPVDWADPGGETFTLALARRPATVPAEREGVLFVNIGGPGGSGVDFALVADRYFSPQVRQRFDIVGIDPRGIARSTEVACPPGRLDQRPSLTPANQAGFARLARFNRQFAAECRALTGPLYDHVDTRSVVEDMDAVRRSLGERTISYFGLSYSTLIGQQYAERYGHRVRAMVLDSVMDHSLGTRGFVETEAAAAEDSFREFVAWCGRTGSCALHGRDVPRLWRSLLRRADRGELSDPGSGTPVTARQVRDRAFADFYGPTWSSLADFLSALDGSTAPTEPTGEADPYLKAHLFPAVFCLDWSMPVRDHRELTTLIKRAARVAPAMGGSPLATEAVGSCVGRSGDTVNPQQRLRITTAPTILLLNARHDPSTAYEWAVNVHRQARDATVLLTYEGWGHGVYDRSACTRNTTDAYLLDLTVPRAGARCAAVEPAAATDRPAPVESLVGPLRSVG